MNTYYRKFIQQYGEKRFLILYTIIFALVLMFVIFGTITFILGQNILIDRLPIVFLGALGFGYATGRNILKKQ